jgi:hypothetical protein
VSTATLGPSADIESGSLLQQLLNELQFSKAVEAWSRYINSLNRWEDEHLLTDNPSPEALAKHKGIVESLMFFGQMCALITAHPEFNDSETAGIISATQNVLRDKLRMFHRPMPREQADLILREVFPEP